MESYGTSTSEEGFASLLRAFAQFSGCPITTARRPEAVADHVHKIFTSSLHFQLDVLYLYTRISEQFTKPPFIRDYQKRDFGLRDRGKLEAFAPMELTGLLLPCCLFFFYRPTFISFLSRRNTERKENQ